MATLLVHIVNDTMHARATHLLLELETMRTRAMKPRRTAVQTAHHSMITKEESVKRQTWKLVIEMLINMVNVATVYPK